jgi:hypothetical protein
VHTYTIEVSDDELHFIIAALGEIAPYKLKEVLQNDYGYKLTNFDSHDLYISLCKICGLEVG